VTTVAEPVTSRTVGRLRDWLSVRHSLRTEALLVLVLYGAYDSTRGLVAGDSSEAVRHARELVRLERAAHVLVERHVQHEAHAVPGLIGLLGICYLTLHLVTTAAVLLWLHRRRQAAFPFVRNTLLLASGLALVGYLAFPTAPPRLAGIGVTDTISADHIDLNRGLISSLYNPYAAVPSMHVAYSLIVAVSVFRYGRSRLLRLLAGFYPPLMLLVVVATGNHFVVDAAAGALVAWIAACLATVVPRRGAATRTLSLRMPAPSATVELRDTDGGFG
jgi:membrane-associated phospholipid phosphatase